MFLSYTAWTNCISNLWKEILSLLKEFSKESLVIMLSPEVSTFLPPHTWKKHEHGSNILQVCNSQQFNKLNEVVESVKIFLPDSLHPPDVLKEFLLHDKDYYLIDQIKSIECCSTENFIRSFICEGSLFLQTVYGKLIWIHTLGSFEIIWYPWPK